MPNGLPTLESEHEGMYGDYDGVGTSKEQSNRLKQSNKNFTPQSRTSKPLGLEMDVKIDDRGFSLNEMHLAMSKSTTSFKGSSPSLKMNKKVASSDIFNQSKQNGKAKPPSHSRLDSASEDEDLRMYTSGDIQSKVSPHFRSQLNQMILEEERNQSMNEGLPKAQQQTKVMYKAMLNSAMKDPKIINMFKRAQLKEGGDVADNGEFIPDYTTFHKFVDEFIGRHKKCGADCIHLQRFYSRIGYYPTYQNRKTMEMKKKDLTNMPDKERHRYKLPLIPKVKKVLQNEVDSL